MDSFAERRLVENELLFRAANRKVQRRIQKDQLPLSHPDTSEFHFYCECSNFHCRDRIIITANEYEAAHVAEKHFITLPGHENRTVEKVISTKPRFTIVEKFMDPAKAVGLK